MNEKKQIVLTTKARRELKKTVNDGRYDVSYTCCGNVTPFFMLTWCGDVVGFYDTMAAMVESVKIHNETRF
jgi:hypothetical protein